MTEQVLFHYTLSGQSLILPLCSSVMLIFQLFALVDSILLGFPLWDLISVNLTEFEHYYISIALRSGELLPSFFFLNNCELNLCTLFIVKPIFHSVKYLNGVINCISISNR